jgi:arylformamidase
MPFDNLPEQPPVYPAEAAAFANVALSLSRQAAQECDITMDVAYGADFWQALDVYRPKETHTEKLPVLVFAHGGAWTHGYKEWCGFMAPLVTSFPAIFISVSYRLAPENKFPCAFDDCVSALKWVHDNIASFGGDTERIYVSGHSAGGHLLTLVTLRRDALERAKLPLDIVKGCFPVSSQLNLVFENPEPGTGEARIYDKFLENKADAVAASPLHQLGYRPEMPFLLTYGTDDFPRIITANDQMFSALKAFNADAELLVLNGFDHFDTQLGLRDKNNPWIVKVRKRMGC